MLSRTSDIHRQIMFYLMLFFCVAASQPELPCTFPCDWINKTFTLYYGNGISLTNLTINADGTTGKIFSDDIQCFQISEQFLITRVLDEETERFSFYCFPVFYTSGQSNFTLAYRDKRTGAVNGPDLCDICTLSLFSMTSSVLALEQPSPAPNVIPRADCEVPFNCQSEGGKVCRQGGSIPKECTSKVTTTTDKTTTTTPDNPTTTRKKPCGRRGRLHRHGQ